MKKRSWEIFPFINLVICVCLGLICLLPMLHVVSMSFSSKNALLSGSVSIFPVGFTWKNYQYVMKDMNFYRSFVVSVARVALALVIQLSVTMLAAYPLSLSKYRFSCRQFYAFFFLITALFSGGMVPIYLIVSATGLLDKIWSLIIPSAVQFFHIVLMMNFMRELPEALTESAMMDGAGYFTVLTRIVLPLCKPSIATVALFIAVNNWNAWFDGMLYINDTMHQPLQTYLRSVLIEIDVTQVSDLSTLAALVDSKGTNAAKIVLAMVPILMVYPFLQKYFVTGMVVGSVKE